MQHHANFMHRDIFIPAFRKKDRDILIFEMAVTLQLLCGRKLRYTDSPRKSRESEKVELSAGTFYISSMLGYGCLSNVIPVISTINANIVQT